MLPSSSATGRWSTSSATKRTTASISVASAGSGDQPLLSATVEEWALIASTARVPANTSGAYARGTCKPRRASFPSSGGLTALGGKRLRELSRSHVEELARLAPRMRSLWTGLDGSEG
jgi:hypothetical protein